MLFHFLDRYPMNYSTPRTIIENNGELRISYDIPGVRKEDVEVTVEENIVALKATRGKIVYKDSVKVPNTYRDPSASLKDGVLTLTFKVSTPKSEAKVIPIQ